MQNIEEKALKTFTENLLYFQEKHEDLFEKLNALNSAIDNGHYCEAYSLEYKDEGYFDVLDLRSGHFLYNESSQMHASLIAQSIDYTKSGNIYETFNDVRISDTYAKELESMQITDSSYSGAASLINYSNKYAQKETTTMKKIYKFIFLGVGLGLHVASIHEKIQGNVYFIIEDDLELFRLSLFCTNYKDIAQSGAELVFSIFENEQDFKDLTDVFLNKQFMYNHFIKFSHLLSHADEKLRKIHGVIASQTYLTFNYSALTTSLLRPLEHIKNRYNILNISETFTGTIFMQKPVLILGAGPSFEKNIPWLQKNADKFIIIAVTPLLSKLEEIGLKPDIITHVHGFSDALPHVQKVKDIAFFDKTIALFGGFTQNEFMAYFKKENIYIFEGSSRYKRWNTGLTSSNIGSISYGLALMLKTREMFLLGLDFATHQESGSTHSSSHNYNRNIELKEETEIGGELILNESVLKVKGNHQKEVFTTLLMNSWKDQCNSLTVSYKHEYHQVFNLSDGAYIDEAIPLELENAVFNSYEKINKDDLYAILQENFTQNSENFFNEKERENLKLRIVYCSEIIDILQKHIHTQHGTLDQYHYNLLGAFYAILKEENEVDSSDTDYIISLYLQFVSGYIFDLINTQEIQDEQELIKHLDGIVIPQLIRIIVFFQESIEKSLED